MDLFKSSTGERERSDYNGARTALTADEWAALSAKDQGLYVVHQSDSDGEMVSRPWDHAAALRVFDGVIDEIGDAFSPDSPLSMRVMSVSEWARGGRR